MKDLLYAIGFGLTIMLAFAACSNEEEQPRNSGKDSTEVIYYRPGGNPRTDWSDEKKANQQGGLDHRAPAIRR